MSWYSKGVRFECQRCLHCCGGEPGWVFLEEEDVEAISSFLGMDREAFMRDCCRIVEGEGGRSRVSLTERGDFSCEFLTAEGCSIYPVRPVQCRTYPFWDHVFCDRAMLELEKTQCPGIGKGRLWTEEEIRAGIRKNSARRLDWLSAAGK